MLSSEVANIQTLMLISSPHRPEVSHKQPDRWLPVFILVLWLCQRTVLNPDTKAFRSITKNAPTPCVLAVNIRTIRYSTAQTNKYSITTEQTSYIYIYIYIYTANDYREISVQSASPSSTLSRLIHAEKSITASIINKYSIRSQGPSSRLLRRPTVMLPFGLSG